MAFTEQDLMAQQQEIARLDEELSRLNIVFEEQKKVLGFAEDEEVTFNDEITPELAQAMNEAKAAAEQAGRARAAQANPASSSAPSRGRRGAMRI
jgi:peptidoglycan hydrolase CwlO-like protein